MEVESLEVVTDKGYRKYPTKKVRIKFVPNKNKLRLRKCIVEHPSGTIERWCASSYLLLNDTYTKKY